MVGNLAARMGEFCCRETLLSCCSRFIFDLTIDLRHFKNEFLSSVLAKRINLIRAEIVNEGVGNLDVPTTSLSEKNSQKLHENNLNSLKVGVTAYKIVMR